MTPEQYIDLKKFVIDNKYSGDIDFYENIKFNQHTESTFAQECIWVICNSGMKNQIALQIYHKVMTALGMEIPVLSVFKHEGKVKAIEYIWERKGFLYGKCWTHRNSPQQLLIELEKIPFIGPITKYHLAKNLGIDVCKPDRHLVRIAEKFKTTPEKLCQKLADATGDRIATVDYVIWRAANLGKI